MRKKRLSGALICAALSMLLSACTARASGQGDDAAQIMSAEIVSSGTSRRFRLIVPSSPDEALPVVILLHGGGGNGDTLADAAGWADKARSEGFIAMFPDGTGRAEGRYTWNAGGCCAYAMQTNAADIQFVSDLIDYAVSQHEADAGRVYLAGMSNGGMLTYLAAAELGERLAGAASVVGASFPDQPREGAPVPFLAINAVQDGVVPYEGGESPMRLVRRSQSQVFLSARESIGIRAMVNGCSNATNDVREGPVLSSSFQGCPDGQEVEFITLYEGGHGWPGGRALRESPEQASGALSATDEIWSFFAAH